MVSFEHVDFWSENHLLNPTTELTLLCINSIETLESVIFFPECLFFCLRLLLTHEVHLLHYIQCLSRFHVVTFHSVCRINFDEILFICFLKSRIGKRTTTTIMEFQSQMSKSKIILFFQDKFLYRNGRFFPASLVLMVTGGYIQKFELPI